MASTGKKRNADEVGASQGSSSKRERACKVDVNWSGQAALDAYKDELEKAEEMVPVLGKLYRDHNVICMYFGQALCNLAPARIIRLHQSAADCGLHAAMPGAEDADSTDNAPASIFHTHELLTALATLDVGPCRVDLGKMTSLYFTAAGTAARGGAKAFLRAQLAPVLGTNRQPLLSDGPQDVVLYGFGRIGRLLARILVEKTGGGDKLRLRAIVVRPPKSGKSDLEKRATLLRIDSVHGEFEGLITTDVQRNALICNGNVVQILYASAPDKIDYTRHGINNAIVIDNTGIYRNRQALSTHLKAHGVAKVLLTAPASAGTDPADTPVPNIVVGVNDHSIDPSETIVAAASCTTNAVCPVLSSLQRRFGIESGHIETVHSYTNDQNLIDNMHSKSRRGRAAALNMVITETGAAKAVGKAMPELAGKLTGNAIRVPTPDVSLAILVLNLSRPTTSVEINEHLRSASVQGPLQRQIDFSASDEVVSSDFVGNTAAGIVDSVATIVSQTDPTKVNLYVWYDNEFGYSSQVVRLTQIMGGVVHPRFPA